MDAAQARRVTDALREAMDDVRRTVAVLAARVRGAHAARVWTLLGYGLSQRALIAVSGRSGDVAELITRRLAALSHSGLKTEAVKDAIAATITALPEDLRRSLTWDRGKELTQHAQLCIDTGLQVYFAEPHSPWQRGTNKNTNGQLRQYFTKGTGLSRWGVDEIEAFALALDNRPRKNLGWKKPAEAPNKHLLLIQETGVATTG
jgi:hypothetical protein